MGVAPAETAVAAGSGADVARALASWEGVVDSVLLRLLPEAPTAEAVTELVRAGAPT
jgi:hypothetical protein